MLQLPIPLDNRINPSLAGHVPSPPFMAEARLGSINALKRQQQADFLEKSSL
jgi:hypothetical protein